MSRKRERICPVCGRSYTDPPALSRRDNKTDICPECGMREALAAIPRREPPRRTDAASRLRYREQVGDRELRGHTLIAETPLGASSRGRARPRSDDGRARNNRKEQQYEKD